MRVQDTTTEHIAEPKRAADRWPRQIKFIVGNEACERFSYYGMRSILAGYITGEVARGGLGQFPDTATSIIHFFVFANYFMPLFGAWLRSRIAEVCQRPRTAGSATAICGGRVRARHGELAWNDDGRSASLPTRQIDLPLLWAGAHRLWLRRHQTVCLRFCWRSISF